MKTAAKVFLIIGMVFGFYLIFPLVLGIFAIKRLDEAKTADELKGWGIVCVFFVSTVGGIFMLCLKDSDLKPDISTYNETPSRAHDKSYQAGEKLLELRKLYDLGIIDEETYNEKRKKYLEDL